MAQSTAALLAISRMWPSYASDEQWTELASDVRGALERHGVDATWKLFAEQLRESQAGDLSDFTRKSLILGLFEQPPQLPQMKFLVTEALDVWPDDIELQGLQVVLDIALGDAEAGLAHLEALHEQFGDRVSHTWLAERYASLDRTEEALRHYRAAAEKQTEDADIHFHIGWYAFITGELKESMAASRRSLELRSTTPMTAFNLGLALLADGQGHAAKSQYRRTVALARRLPVGQVRGELDGAIGDFALLNKFQTVAVEAEGIREWLQKERDGLEPPELDEAKST